MPRRPGRPQNPDEERSFDDFFRSTVGRVVVMIALVTEDFAAAEDAAQIAYTRAYRRWSEIAGLERLEMWVIRVGTNVAIDNWRKRKKEVQLPESHQISGDDYVQAMSVRWGLDKLSHQQRLAMVLHYAYGLPVNEIAEQLGTSEPTVKTHLSRGRRRLRTLLRQHEEPT